jgi:hypothetical protein
MTSKVIRKKGKTFTEIREYKKPANPKNTVYFIDPIPKYFNTPSIGPVC